MGRKGWFGYSSDWGEDGDFDQGCHPETPVVIGLRDSHKPEDKGQKEEDPMG